MFNKTYQNITQLSASALSLFLECPKCFWLQKVNGIHRPSQIFALQSNFDRILKTYFDKFRKEDKLPPELVGKVEGKLFDDLELIEKWRNAIRPTLKYSHPQYPDFVLAGGLDDCLFDGKHYIPLDFKTTGSSSFEENSEKYYQHQLDIYNLLLEENGHKTRGIAYLIYYKPEEVAAEGLMKFQITVKKMETNHQRALKLFENAIELLSNPMPKSHSDCQFCSWANDFID